MLAVVIACLILGVSFMLLGDKGTLLQYITFLPNIKSLEEAFWHA